MCAGPWWVRGAPARAQSHGVGTRSSQQCSLCGMHEVPTTSQPALPLPFLLLQNLLHRGNKQDQHKSLPCQEPCRGMEPDHLWFVPPRPQLGDAGLSSAPGGPSQSSDQRSHRHTGILPARTGLSSGTRSQGSPGSGGSLGGPGWHPLPHGRTLGSCCRSSVPAERRGRGLSPPRAPHGSAGRTGRAVAPTVPGRPRVARTPRPAGERPPPAPFPGWARSAAPAPRGRAPRPAPGPRR